MAARKRRDPKCKHYTQATGRVAWPTGMPEDGESHASTTVCARTECREDAAEWVEEITGTRGQFVPFRRHAEPSEPALFSLTTPGASDAR